MEDASYTSLAKFLVPKLPRLLLASAAHALSLSPTSSKWDLQTTLQVAVLRAIMDVTKPQPVGRSQALSLRDPGPRGKVWTASARVPAAPGGGGSTTAAVVVGAIADMGDGREAYGRPESVDVPVEWIGFRSKAKTADEPLPSGLTEQQRYDRLMADPNRTSDTTLLYFHGGAYYMCSLGTHRVPVSKYVRACNGRALFVDYRLAPQAAFPSQLLDAFNAYLYLVYPPPGTLHEPVPASSIVFAGDSAGGNLVFALLQLVLQLHRTSSTTIQYNGAEVQVPLPAGVIGLSAWFDIARSSPSLHSNVSFDYLPPPSLDGIISFPSDDVWPTKPPRGDVFCDLSLLDHPLVSPLVAKDWSNSPPMCVIAGDEMLYDENAIVAARAADQGVTVQWEHYEAMPHIFSMMVPHLSNSKMCVRNVGKFARECVEGGVKAKSEFVRANSGKVEQVELEIGKEVPFAWEQAVQNVKAAKGRRLNAYESAAKVLPKPNL